MDDPPLCKKCLQADRKTKLRLYHLNFKEALYMCPVKQCFFPLFKKEIRDYVVPYETSVSESDLCDSEEELQASELACVETPDCNLNSSRIEKLNLSECLKTSPVISISEINLGCQISHVDNSELIDKHRKKNSPQRPQAVCELLLGMEQCNSHVNAMLRSQTANDNGERKETDLFLCASQIGVPVLEHSGTKRKMSVGLDPADSSYIFPVWHDKDSLSWLDASIALLVCNKKLKDIITSSSVRSHLKIFCHVYSDALCRLNTVTLDVSKDGCQLPLSTLLSIKKELKCAQEEMLNFLRPNLYPESKNLPVLAIENLLKEDVMIRNLFLVSYGWDMTCWSCGACIKERKQSTVLSLLDGCPDFSSEYPYYERTCPTCKKKEQKMFFHFSGHPPKTMLLYFGTGSSCLNATDLRKIAANRNHYHVTGILQYVIESSHYIAWIRNPIDSSWLCFDDWGPAYQQYSYEAPQISGNEISLVMWEQDENASKTSPKIGGILSINDYLDRLKSLSLTPNCIKNREKMYKTLFSNSNLQAGYRTDESSKIFFPVKKNSSTIIHSSSEDMFVNKENFLYGKVKSCHGNVRHLSLSVLGHSGQGKVVVNEGAASSDCSSNCKSSLTVRNISEKLNAPSSVKTDPYREEECECPPILQAVGMIRKSDYDKVVAKQSKSQRTRCFGTLPNSFAFQNVHLSKSRTSKKPKSKCKGAPRAPRAKKAKTINNASIATKPNKKTPTSDKSLHLEEDFHTCPEAVVEVEVSTCNSIVDVENSLPSFCNPVCKKKNKTVPKSKGTKQKNISGAKTNNIKRIATQRRGRRKLKTVDCVESKDAENFESSSQSSEEHFIERYKLFTPLNFSSPSSEYLSSGAIVVEQSVDSFDVPEELVPVPSSDPIPEENVDSESSEDLVELKRSTRNYSQKHKSM